MEMVFMNVKNVIRENTIKILKVNPVVKIRLQDVHQDINYK